MSTDNKGMFRQFIGDSFAYSVAALISALIGIFIIPVYTRLLSPYDYGVIDTITVLANIGLALFTLQMNQSIARFLPDARDDAERQRISSSALFIALMGLLILYALSLLFTGILSNWIFNSTGYESVYRWAMSSILITGIFQILQGQLRFEMKARQCAIITSCNAIIVVIITVIAILVFNAGLLGVYVGLVAGSSIAVVWALYELRNSYRWIVDRMAAKNMLVYAVAFIPASITMYLAQGIDRIFIKELMSLSDVGIYGIAYRLASIAALVMAVVQNSLGPIILHGYQKEHIQSELNKVFILCHLGFVCLWLGLSVLADELLRIFTMPVYYDAAAYVPILTATVIVANLQIFYPGIMIAKKSYLVLMVTAFSIFLSFAGNMILVPAFGLYGAALAALASAVGGLVLYSVFSERYFQTSYPWFKVGGAYAGALIAYSLSTLLPDTGLGILVIKIGILMVSGTALILWLVPGSYRKAIMKSIKSRLAAAG